MQARSAKRACSQHSRQRWCRVRVETDAGTYFGSLELGAHGGLRELVGDERVYLRLWNATQEGSLGIEEFMALHKGVICSVVVLGEERQAPARLQGA